MNSANLVGRLTKDIEIRYTQGSDAVGTFNLAVNRPFKNANGEREADFINCVVWRKTAENLANFTHRGSQIGVTGRIQTRNYDKDGQRVYVTEVIVESFDLLDKREDNGQQSGNQSRPQNNQQNVNQYGNSNRQGGYNNQPQNNQQNGRPFDNVSVPNNVPSSNQNGRPIDISDDQLPF